MDRLLNSPGKVDALHLGDAVAFLGELLVALLLDVIGSLAILLVLKAALLARDSLLDTVSYTVLGTCSQTSLGTLRHTGSGAAVLTTGGAYPWRETSKRARRRAEARMVFIMQDC